MGAKLLNERLLRALEFMIWKLKVEGMTNGRTERDTRRDERTLGYTGDGGEGKWLRRGKVRCDR